MKYYILARDGNIPDPQFALPADRIIHLFNEGFQLRGGEQFIEYKPDNSAQ